MSAALAYDERSGYWEPPKRHLELVRLDPIERPNIWLPRPRRHLRLVRPIEIMNAIAFVNNVGVGVKTTTSTTVTLVPTQNCGAGNFLALVAGMGGTATLTGVTDTKSNTWVVDKTQGTTGSPANLATTLQDGGALTTGDTITCTGASGANKVCAAIEFSGIATGTRLDQVTGATGTTSTTPSAGPTGTLAQSVEVVIGAFSWAGAAQRTFTKGASYTAVLEKDETSGAFLGVAIEYVIVSSTAAVTADGTLSAAPTSWNAIVATYLGVAAAAGAQPRAAISAPPVPVQISSQIGAGY